MNRWSGIIINFLGFQACWLALVFTSPAGLLWLAVLVAFAWLVFYLVRSPQPAREAPLLLIGAAVGTAWDSVSVCSGLIGTQGSHVLTLSFLARFFALWMSFGTTLRVTYSWCWRRLWIAALIGAAGGPASYWCGAKAGAIDLPADPTVSLAAVAAQFALLFPLWLYVARRTLTAGAKA